MTRRRLLAAASAACGAALPRGAAAAAPEPSPAGGAGTGLRLWTFGDSVLDCGHYNSHGVTPGALVIRNDDRLFPDFARHDLASRGLRVALAHRAVDGARVSDLAGQAHGMVAGRDDIAFVSVGGNDLLRGLMVDEGPGFNAFEATLDRFLAGLPVGRRVLATVYDPTFGDDRRNFLGVPADLARRGHERMNEILRRLARRHGRLADLHAHFLTGDPSWFANAIEPSLTGASEIRRVFLDCL